MAAMPPDGAGLASADVPPPAPPGTPEVQRQARYNHLVSRLRGRQITMEEATELFALMQAMLRASEVARRNATQAALGRAGPTGPLAHVVRTQGAAPAGSDDLFLVGLLAMGAGAGLLAAMARRLAEPPPPADSRNEKGPASRRDP
jgi:hypothetical protein